MLLDHFRPDTTSDVLNITSRLPEYDPLQSLDPFDSIAATYITVSAQLAGC